MILYLRKQYATLETDRKKIKIILRVKFQKGNVKIFNANDFISFYAISEKQR